MFHGSCGSCVVPGLVDVKDTQAVAAVVLPSVVLHIFGSLDLREGIL